MVMSARPGLVSAERPSRRRLPRLVLVGVLLSALVLAVDSIASTVEDGPDERLAYLDEVRPMVDDSTRQGVAVEDLRNRAAELGRSGVRRSLERLSRDTRRSLEEVRGVEAPLSVGEAHGLLVAAVATRARAAAAMDEALSRALDHDPPEQAVQALVEVGRDFVVADRAYQLFVEALPPGIRDAAPPSRWIADDQRWSRVEMSLFVSTLRSSASLAPVHDVGIITITTDPSPVALDGTAEVLPMVKTLRLQVIVANAGNEAERRVTVEGLVTSAGGLDSARQFVDLAPGQRLTVPLGLRPASAGTLVVVVNVGPVAGETNRADNERSLLFVMR
jgi:hypothetical protein